MLITKTVSSVFTSNFCAAYLTPTKQRTAITLGAYPANANIQRFGETPLHNCSTVTGWFAHLKVRLFQHLQVIRLVTAGRGRPLEEISPFCYDWIIAAFAHPIVQHIIIAIVVVIHQFFPSTHPTACFIGSNADTVLLTLAVASTVSIRIHTSVSCVLAFHLLGFYRSDSGWGRVVLHLPQCFGIRLLSVYDLARRFG